MKIIPGRPIAIGEIEAAINRARGAEPALGIEARLSPDVAVLGALYGRLIWARARSIDPAQLVPREREALERWVP